jgi:hypothetical protein
MIKRIGSFGLSLGIVRLMVFGLVAAAQFFSPPSASAQLSRMGGTINALIPGSIMRGTDTAYDPAHGVYLIVVGNGPIFGVFVNVQGVPVTGPFTIMATPGAWGHFPRATYSPDVLGGQGGFLVTWHNNVDAAATLHCVFGRIVSFVQPGAIVSQIQQISDGSQGGTWHETGPAMAYSRTSRRFLVGWRTLQYGIQGRWVDAGGTPFGGVMQLESPGGSRDPAFTWNPATDEFGIMYTGFGAGGAFAGFRRLRVSDGFLSGRTSFGFAAGTFATAIDVNSSNQYIVTWALHPGTMSATFDPNGTLLATNLVSTRLGFDQSLGMAFNTATGTALVVSNDISSYEIAAVELRSSGAPAGTAGAITDGAQIGSFYPMTIPRTQTNQWDVVYARDFAGATNQIIQTGTRDGVAPPPQQPPPPPSQPGGCTTPDPFVSLGGGRCVNGGWLPPGGGTPPPPSQPPPPPQPQCTTPDPFVAIGGGVCVRPPTGWVPRSSVSTCTTPDPFASLGGGQCVNGGWVPRTSGSVCSTPDPFVSIGGGVCVNGGWRPRARLEDAFPPWIGLDGDVVRPFRAPMRPESKPVTG